MLGISDGIEVLNKLFSSIVYDSLPEGTLWLEQLDILRAVRFSSASTLKKFEDYYVEVLSGYIDVGIEKNSDNYDKALKIIHEAILPEDLLCDHELRQGYVRLRMTGIDNINAISFYRNVKVHGNKQLPEIQVLVKLSDEQKQAIKEIYALYDSDTERRKENVTEFFRLWDNFEVLKGVNYPRL